LPKSKIEKGVKEQSDEKEKAMWGDDSHRK